MEQRLESLFVSGFKSIRSVSLPFSNLNVLIGANGAGKSSLVSFFNMMSYILSPPSGALKLYVGESGGANALLHEGAKITKEVEAQFKLRTIRGVNEYRFRLVYAASDNFFFAQESCRFLPNGVEEGAWLELGAGHAEANLLSRASEQAKITRNTIAGLLRGLIVYHFHDTSREARIKSRSRVSDTAYLRSDAANLASFLLHMRDNKPRYYERIVRTIKQIAPFFEDFYLIEESGSVLLRWKERGSAYIFSADQASDGSLRAMALVTALMQPPEKLPTLMIIDEPELGLHPYAVSIIGGLIKSVASKRQILIATQSAQLLDLFESEDVIVVERPGRASEFKRLPPEATTIWLEEYSLSDLWNKNIIGGRPKEFES